MEKSQSTLRNCIKIGKEETHKHMHIGKELQAHYLEKGHLSCDSGAPEVGSARSDSTRVVKVNRL